MSQTTPKSSAAGLVSPFGVANVSLAFFLLSWLLPPGLYSFYVPETDYLFFDLKTLAFVLLCYLAFVLGSKLTGPKPEDYAREAIDRPEHQIGLFTFLLPLGFAFLYTGVFLIESNGNIDLLSMLRSGQGQSVKLANGTGQLYSGFWAHSLNLSMALVWWTIYRLRESGLNKSDVRIVRFATAAVFVLASFTTLLRADRGSLLPIILGSLVVFLYDWGRSRGVSMAKLITGAAIACGGGVLLMLVLTVARGAGTERMVMFGALGYSAASYNRLAAMIHGILAETYGGRGLYLFSYLTESHWLDYIFHFRDALQWPTSREVLQGEFQSTMASGLVPLFNWPSCFGYLYADLGWGAPIFFGSVGILTGYSFKRFLKGTVFGVVLYPWFALSVLFWFCVNEVFEARLFELIILGGILLMYENAMFPREEESVAQWRPAATSESGSGPATINIPPRNPGA